MSSWIINAIDKRVWLIGALGHLLMSYFRKILLSLL